MTTRRRFITGIATTAAIIITGCTGGSNGSSSNSVESGRVSNDDHTKKIEVEEGETIRIEADNVEGEGTLVSLLNPKGDQLFSKFVETEDTFTHTAERSGIFSLIVSQPDGTASYQIYIE